MEKGKRGCCPSWWPVAKGKGGKNFGVGNEERERERERDCVCVCVLPNGDFLPIFTLIYLTSYNEIMPSAPSKIISLHLYLTHIGEAPYFPLHDAFVPNKYGGKYGRKKSKVHVHMYTYIHLY